MKVVSLKLSMKTTISFVLLAAPFLASMLSSIAAQADLSRSTIFAMNTIYIDRDYTENGVSLQSKQTDTDLRLMRVEKKWSYGAIFSQSANDSSDAGRSSYGLTTGYYSDKDFYINFSYFFNSKYSTGGADYKGNGNEIDLGFVSKITSSFYAGLMIARKEFKYTDQTIAGVSSTADVAHRELIPMFTFAVVFQ